MNSRITHTMLQRNVLADLNAVSNRLSATPSAMSASRHHRPTLPVRLMSTSSISSIVDMARAEAW